MESVYAENDRFLTDEALAAATERISDAKVEPADDPLDVLDQRVNVSFTLAGLEYTEELTMSRGGNPSSVSSRRGICRTRSRRACCSAWMGRVYPLEVLESDWVTLEESEVVIDGGDVDGYLTMMPTTTRYL